MEPSTAKFATSPTVSRVGGSDRYSSAIAVSKAAFPAGAGTVYIASGTTSFANALVAGPVAAKARGPILLSTPTEISTATMSEIARLGAEKVVVIGDATAVGDGVVAKLKTLATDVSRVGGGERFESARKIVESGFTTAPTVIIIPGESFLGALPATAAAAQIGAPIVPVAGAQATLDQATRTHLTGLGATRAIIAGNTTMVSAGVESALRAFVPQVERASGADQYEIAVKLNSLLFPSSARAYLVSGADFSEGLGVASLALATGGPVYTTQTSCVSDSAKADITGRLGATLVTLIGGTASLGAGVAGLVSCSEWNAQQKKTSEQALLSKLTAAVPSLPGRYSITVRELTGLKRTVAYQSGYRAEPASSIKLFALYAALKRIDEGRLYYSTKVAPGFTLAQCMRAMIHVSDNYCHEDIIRLIGATNLNAQFAAAGFTGTHYSGTWKGQYYAYKTSTANDLTDLLMRLNAGTLVSAASTKYMLALMKEQIWRSRIPSGLPPGVAQASKPGELWVSSGMTEIDAALVYAPKGTYTLAIMGYQGATKAALAKLSRIVYEHFNGAISTTATFPLQQLRATAATAVRSSAGGSALFTIASGTYVEVIDSVRMWYRVKVNGRTGYVSNAYLANRY